MPRTINIIPSERCNRNKKVHLHNDLLKFHFYYASLPKHSADIRTANSEAIQGLVLDVIMVCNTTDITPRRSFFLDAIFVTYSNTIANFIFSNLHF